MIHEVNKYVGVGKQIRRFSEENEKRRQKRKTSTRLE